MEINVDASVIIAVLLNEPEKSTIQRLTENSFLIAPHSIYWEVGNAFSSAIKKKRLDVKQVELALEEFHSIPIRYVEPDLTASLKICNEKNIYAYDAYLIQSSIRYHLPLMTLDNRLKQVAIELNVNVIEVEE